MSNLRLPEQWCKQVYGMMPRPDIEIVLTDNVPTASLEAKDGNKKFVLCQGTVEEVSLRVRNAVQTVMATGVSLTPIACLESWYHD